jgi:hypothetical protein
MSTPRCLEGENPSRAWRTSREVCDRPAQAPWGLCPRHTAEWQAHTGHTEADALRALRSLLLDDTDG